MEFVDDLAGPNRSVQSVSVSNQIIKQIPREKRLNFSTRKCELLFNWSGRGQLQIKS